MHCMLVCAQVWEEAGLQAVEGLLAVEAAPGDDQKKPMLTTGVHLAWHGMHT